MILLTAKSFFAIICHLLALTVSTSATGPYLTQQEALDLNAELINTYKYTQEQLAELSGFCAASAIEHAYPKRGRVLVICGPGNNGGDGLVCARHLKSFGYLPDVYYPYPSKQPMFENLMHQCRSQNITLLRRIPVPKTKKLNQDYKFIVDALFGVGFKPKPRAEYVQILCNLWETQTPLVSIDVPSGWHVELGPNIDNIRPEFLISVGAPKQCAKFFEGKYHYLGGRFIPPALLEKYNLSLPSYYKDECFMRLN